MITTLAFVTATLGLAAPPAGAWSDGVCTDASGITVVIDFQELGGGVHVRCASGPAATGFDALSRAGIDYQTTVKFPGFLCRIAGLPTNDPCQTTSPATAYWSYWLASRGGEWCYSNWGAGSRTPPPGSVEAWSFSLGRDGSTSPSPRVDVPPALPGSSPAQLRGNDCDPRANASAPGPRPPADPTPSAAPGSGASTPGGDGGGGAGGNGNAGGAAGGPIDAGAPVGAPGAGEAPTGTGTDGPSDPATPPGDTTTSTVESIGDDPTATTTTADGAAAATTTVVGTDDIEQTLAVDLGGDGSSGGGSPVGVLVALLLVVVLSGAAFYVRRHAARA
ncbi:MAG: hypothetical protein ACYC2O_06315 [Microthrixaceae bacterium]